MLIQIHFLLGLAHANPDHFFSSHPEQVTEALPSHMLVFHKHSLCMWLYAFTQAVWFSGVSYPQGLYLMHGSDAFPMPSLCFGMTLLL